MVAQNSYDVAGAKVSKTTAKKWEAGSGANGQMHGRYVIGGEPARYADTLGAFRRDEEPQVGIRSRIVQEADMICEIGGEDRCAVSFDVARRRHNGRSGEAAASYHQESIRDLPRMHGEIQPLTRLDRPRRA